MPIVPAAWLLDNGKSHGGDMAHCSLALFIANVRKALYGFAHETRERLKRFVTFCAVFVVATNMVAINLENQGSESSFVFLGFFFFFGLNPQSTKEKSDR